MYTYISYSKGDVQLGMQQGQMVSQNDQIQLT